MLKEMEQKTEAKSILKEIQEIENIENIENIQNKIQVKSILTEYSGAVCAEDVKQISVFTKYNIPLWEEIKDASKRGNAVLVINLAADDKNAQINQYLSLYQKEKLNAAIRAAAEAANAAEIVVVKAKEVSYQAADTNIKVLETESNPVLREESALYYFVEKGEVRSQPLEKEYLSKGLGSQPCVTADGETLCRIYQIANGTAKNTKLVIMKYKTESFLIEIPVGTNLSTILKECGISAEKGVVIGGILGKFIAKEELEQYSVLTDALWDLIWILDEKDCIADITLSMALETKEKSCGKCVLCREGIWHITNIMKEVTTGKAKKEDLDMILDIGRFMEAGSFCSFGQKMSRLFVSLVEKNRSEMETHFIKKSCPAGVCSAFFKLVIDPAKCTGCTDCADECSEDAINGKKGFIHIIDSELCENCGKCVKACEENAIVIQDGTIRIPKKLVKAGKFK